MKKVFVIAEAGVNHNGKIKIAKKLINCAKECGADAVKFQTFMWSTFKSQSVNCWLSVKKKIKQLDLLKKLSLSFKQFIILKKYCKKKKFIFCPQPLISKV